MSDAPAAPAPDLALRAARGTALSLAGQLVTHALRLASNLVLTRILEPDAFGLMMIVSAITVGLQMLSDVGLGQAVVQSPRRDRDFLDTAWTLSVLRGLALFLLGCLAAFPASWLWGRAELRWLLPVCAFQAVLLGLESTKTLERQRALVLDRLIVVELGSQVLALLASVLIARATGSVLALAAAAAVALVTRTAASHWLFPGPNNRLRLERGAVRELFSFGAWVFVSTTLLFLGLRWDVFALGKLEGMTLVGVFGIAQMVLTVPAQMIDRALNVVLLPALAERFRATPAAFADDLRRAHALVLPAAAALLLGAALGAPAFFQWLYRDAYHDAAWLTQLLVAGAWFVVVQELGKRAMVAAGATRLLVLTNGARLLVTVAASSLGFARYGVVGFVAGTTLGAAVGALASSALLVRFGARLFARDVLASAAFLLLLALGCGLPRLWAAPLGVDVALLSLGAAPLLVGPLGLFALSRARATLGAARGNLSGS